MVTVFVSMFIFSLVGAVSPGPVNIIALGTGANYGYRRALPHVLGASVAYALIVLLVGLGINQLSESFDSFVELLRYVGGAFLFYMAFKIARAHPIKFGDNASLFKAPTLIEGALAQGLNPKAWLVSASGVSLFVPINNQAMIYLAVFCVISFVVCVMSISVWATAGQRIGKVLSSAKRQKTFNLAMALMLSCTVIAIVLT